MNSPRLLSGPGLGAALLVGLLLAGCASRPVPPAPVTPPAPPSTQAARETFRVWFEDGLELNYQLERKLSTINGKSCYFFLSGSLLNQSARTLGKASVLDFVAISQGRQAYRDLANPVSDIAPGARAQFGLLSSPVFQDGCPVYDRLSVSLRPVFLD